MIIRLQQILIGTTEFSLLSSSSGTLIKRQSKALFIYRDKKVIREVIRGDQWYLNKYLKVLICKTI